MPGCHHHHKRYESLLGVGEGDKIIPLRFVPTNGLQRYESCVASLHAASGIEYVLGRAARTCNGDAA